MNYQAYVFFTCKLHGNTPPDTKTHQQQYHQPPRFHIFWQGQVSISSWKGLSSFRAKCSLNSLSVGKSWAFPPLKFNIALKKGCLEDDLDFWDAYLLGTMLKFGGVSLQNIGRISTKKHFRPTLHNSICANNFSLKKGHEVCARGLEDASNMILINNNKTNTWSSLSTLNLHFTNSDVPLMFALFCRRSFLLFRNRSLPSPL